MSDNIKTNRFGGLYECTCYYESPCPPCEEDQRALKQEKKRGEQMEWLFEAVEKLLYDRGIYLPRPK